MWFLKRTWCALGDTKDEFAGTCTYSSLFHLATDSGVLNRFIQPYAATVTRRDWVSYQAGVAMTSPTLSSIPIEGIHRVLISSTYSNPTALHLACPGCHFARARAPALRSHCRRRTARSENWVARYRRRTARVENWAARYRTRTASCRSMAARILKGVLSFHPLTCPEWRTAERSEVNQHRHHAEGNTVKACGARPSKCWAC